VRGPLDIDDVEDLEPDAGTPDDHRAVAARLAEWSEERHPEDHAEVTPAALLVLAAEHLGLAGDHAGALELYRRAARAEGDVAPDIRCFLHHGLIAVGDLAAARRLAEEIRRSRPADADVYALIGEDYEAAGDLAEANRWMNLGLHRFLGQIEDGDDESPDTTGVLLLTARRRVRQSLGFPPDEFDDLLPPPV
jgi:tetratricopeptide (TPR) repeat protein